MPLSDLEVHRVVRLLAGRFGCELPRGHGPLWLGARVLAAPLAGAPTPVRVLLEWLARLNAEIKRLCCVRAISGWVSDTVFDMLLEDDRILGKFQELEDEIEGEIRFVSALAMPVLICLAEATGCSSRHLLSDMVAAALTSAACILNRTRSAMEVPWFFFVGDSAA